MTFDEFYKNNEDKIVISGFSPDDESAVMRVLKLAYNMSPTFKDMLDIGLAAQALI